MATKQVPIRLNLDNEDEAKAYEYIQGMDKTIYTSYTKVFTAAIINLFDDKKPKTEPNSRPAIPIANNNSNSKNIDTVEIAKVVKDEISNALPELVAATLMRMLQIGGGAVSNTDLQVEKVKDEEPVPQLSEEAWNFIDCING